LVQLIIFQIPQTKLCQRVHIKEVLEGQPEPTEAEPPPGLACPEPDNMNKGDQLFVCFIGEQTEDVKATQTISQKLTEGAGETHSTLFKDIVPKPYQEFKNVFAQELSGFFLFKVISSELRFYQPI